MTKKIIFLLTIIIVTSTPVINGMEEEPTKNNAVEKITADYRYFAIISGDKKKFEIDRSFLAYINCCKEEIAASNQIILAHSSTTVKAAILLLKCIETPAEREVTKSIFLVLKNIKNPQDLKDLTACCTKLEVPKRILTALKKRKKQGYSVAELLDNNVKLPIAPPGTLNLSGKLITSLEGLERIPEIKTVEALNLSDNGLKKINPKILKACKQIKRLYLNNNQLEKLNHKDIAMLSYLECLDCSYNNLKNLPDNTLTSCKKLFLANFEHNQFETKPTAPSNIKNFFS